MKRIILAYLTAVMIIVPKGQLHSEVIHHGQNVNREKLEKRIENKNKAEYLQLMKVYLEEEVIKKIIYMPIPSWKKNAIIEEVDEDFGTLVRYCQDDRVTLEQCENAGFYVQMRAYMMMQTKTIPTQEI